MIKLDEKKLAQLKTGSQHFDEKYGPAGSPSRVEFEAKAKAWYYAELLRDERKRQKLTQQQLGERIGKKREYISSLEQGQIDMHLSTFMLIANALGLRFSLVIGSMRCITIAGNRKSHSKRKRKYQNCRISLYSLLFLLLPSFCY